MFRVPTKPGIARHIPIAIFKHQNRRFVDFYSHVGVFGEISVAGCRSTNCMVDIGFFASGDTSIDFVYETAVNEFEKDHSGSWIEDLF